MSSFYDYLKNEMAKQGALSSLSVSVRTTAMDCGGCGGPEGPTPSWLWGQTVCGVKIPYPAGKEPKKNDDDAHPRKKKGEKGGGQFTKKPETLAKEDDRDRLDKNAVEDPIVKATKEKISGYQKEYSDLARRMARDMFSLHGTNFTEIANRMSSIRSKLRQKIKMIGGMGVNVEGDLENGYSFREGQSKTSAHKVKVVSHKSGYSGSHNDCKSSC